MNAVCHFSLEHSVDDFVIISFHFLRLSSEFLALAKRCLHYSADDCLSLGVELLGKLVRLSLPESTLPFARTYNGADEGLEVIVELFKAIDLINR
jgi:hypothetical protein